MNNESKNHMNDATIQAVVAFGKLLTNIAGAILVLTASAYYIGWLEVSAYYNNLGAAWAISMVPSIHFVEISASLVYLMGIITLLSIAGLLNKEASAKGLRRTSLIFLGIYILLTLPSIFISNSKALQFVYLSSDFSGLFLSLGAGFTIGELIARLAEGDFRWDYYNIMLVVFFITFGVFMAPNQIGYAKAQFDADINQSPLPIVQTSKDDGAKWRLVTVDNGYVLLIELAKKHKDRIFRVVPASEIRRIQSR